MNKKRNSATRYIVFLEKAADVAGGYTYKVIDSKYPGYRAMGPCNLRIAKCLRLVYSDAVLNYRIVDNEIVLGWSKEAFAVFERILKKLPSAFVAIRGEEDDAQHGGNDSAGAGEDLWNLFDMGDIPESTPDIGQPGFHWGM